MFFFPHLFLAHKLQQQNHIEVILKILKKKFVLNIQAARRRLEDQLRANQDAMGRLGGQLNNTAGSGDVKLV
jgi:hypothetical protein